MVKCERMELGEPYYRTKKTGPIANSEFTRNRYAYSGYRYKMLTHLSEIRQPVELNEKMELSLTKQWELHAVIYAGGDAVSGSATVI